MTLITQNFSAITPKRWFILSEFLRNTVTVELYRLEPSLSN